MPRNDCEFSYIGQTKRDLKTRILEHQRAVRNQQPEKSILREHSLIHNYRIKMVVSKHLTHFCYPIRLVFHQHLNSHVTCPDIPPENSNHTRG